MSMIAGTTIFEGERIAKYPERPDKLYVVTKWRRMGRGIEAVEGHPATDDEVRRIDERTNKPNAEYEGPDGRTMFICRTCMVHYPHSGGIVLAACPGCDTSPGFIKRSIERNRLATAR